MFCFQCEPDAPAVPEIQVSAEKRQILHSYRMN
jgi:hypothetical protein